MTNLIVFRSILAPNINANTVCSPLLIEAILFPSPSSNVL